MLAPLDVITHSPLVSPQVTDESNISVQEGLLHAPMIMPSLAQTVMHEQFENIGTQLIAPELLEVVDTPLDELVVDKPELLEDAAISPLELDDVELPELLELDVVEVEVEPLDELLLEEELVEV